MNRMADFALGFLHARQRASVWMLTVLLCLPLLAQAAPVMQLSAPIWLDAPRLAASEAIVREAYRRIGYEVHTTVLPGERSMASANSGAMDGELVRKAGMSEHYPNLIPVRTPISRYTLVPYVIAPIGPFHDWKSLSGYRIGAIRGTKVIEENGQQAGLDIRYTNTLSSLILLLQAKRIDVALVFDMFETQSYQALHQRGVIREGEIVRLPDLLQFDVYHYVHVKHAELVPRLDQALQAMRDDGTYRRIYREAGRADLNPFAAVR